MPNVHLMHDSDSFNPTDIVATTVGALKEELGVSATSRVNINTSVASDSTTINDGDLIAVVAKDKKGGK